MGRQVNTRWRRDAPRGMQAREGGARAARGRREGGARAVHLLCDEVPQHAQRLCASLLGVPGSLRAARLLARSHQPLPARSLTDGLLLPLRGGKSCLTPLGRCGVLLLAQPPRRIIRSVAAVRGVRPRCRRAARGAQARSAQARSAQGGGAQARSAARDRADGVGRPTPVYRPAGPGTVRRARGAARHARHARHTQPPRRRPCGAGRAGQLAAQLP